MLVDFSSAVAVYKILGVFFKDFKQYTVKIKVTKRFFTAMQ